MTTKTAKWIEAGKIIEKEKNAKVLCPNCENGFLSIKDVTIGKTFERYMICELCGSWNVITFSTGLDLDDSLKEPLPSKSKYKYKL